MHITYVSSYIPRKCGIATYTRDIASAVSIDHEVSVVAMENPSLPTIYSQPVIHIIKQHILKDYLHSADALNAGSTEIIHLQHEFGLYGGEDGEYILQFVKRLQKPLITTFHTVLETPSPKQKHIIQELARISMKSIVMDKIGKSRLESIYGLNPQDSQIILHGAPIIDTEHRETVKTGVGFPHTFLVLSNNLLSRNKGIEFGIEAVAKALVKIPNLIYLVAGETHPVVKNSEGEAYRRELTDLVAKLHLQKQVIFINRYLSLTELGKYFSAADVYLTPYLDPQQTVSGTLSYAIGAGKACIATSYVYAKNMLSHGRGVLVPFSDSQAIAEALINLFQNPQIHQAMELKTTELRKRMSWEHVADKHIACYADILERCQTISAVALKMLKSTLNIDHLVNLTDEIGIFQHAKRVLPNAEFGYSTDDNARALIILSHLHRQKATPQSTLMLKTYLQFLKSAQSVDGSFYTFLSETGKWLDQSRHSDAYGRAMWGLGLYLYAQKDGRSNIVAQTMFESGLKQCDMIQDLRTAAYVILGLYYYIKANHKNVEQKNKAVKQLKKLGDFLVDNFGKTQKDNWQWYEEIITYDSFRLPQAMLAIYLITKDVAYKDIAEVSLQFLYENTFNPSRNYFDFIGQDGWQDRQGIKANYDQQPLEAAAAIEAYIFADKAAPQKEYLAKSHVAFEWFFGRNRNHRSIYDQTHNGVFDGLTPRGVNLNEGAESIICFLMAQWSLQQTTHKASQVLDL